MKIRKLIILISFIFCGTFILKGQGDYLGQATPENTPELFAPGVISTEYHEHSFPSFSPDGSTVLWNIEFMGNYIYDFPTKVSIVEMKNKVWSESKYFDALSLPNSAGACFSPDGNKIFFIADSSSIPENSNYDIWFIEKISNSWSKPQKVPGLANTKAPETQLSVTNNGTLYYTSHMEGVKNNRGILRSRLVNGKYQEPESLPETINSKDVFEWTPFIAPDESYLLFCSYREGGQGSGDIYISYRDKNDNWTEAINLGPTINDKYNERFPYISPDGKYLFFLSDRVSEELLSKKELSYKEAVHYFSKPGNGFCDIYWVKADIIEELRPKN